MLPIGFVCLVAGVALPRIEGTFTAGPQGISAPLLDVSKLDTTYAVFGSAVAAVRAATAAALPAGQAAGPVLGDVWDALDAVIDKGTGFRGVGAAGGRALIEVPDARLFELVNQGFLDWRPASGELLDLLSTWGVRPVVSGKYTVPDHLDPSKATGPVSPRLIRGGDGRPASR